VPWGESIAAATTGAPVPSASQGSYIQGQGNAAPPGVNPTTIRGNRAIAAAIIIKLLS